MEEVGTLEKNAAVESALDKTNCSIADLEEMARQVRRDVIRMLVLAKSGHTGGSLGLADVFAAMYFKLLDHSPEKFATAANQDFMFVSNGHIAPVWYSVLARSGYFPTKKLAFLRKIDSCLQGHPTTDPCIPGVRIASGSLGQGLSAAIGAALSFKTDGKPNTVYCMMGDGECQEGQIWEAAMSAAHFKTDNLIGIVDHNNQQIDGEVEAVMGLEPFADKWKAFGWEVLSCDGNSIADFVQTVEKAKTFSGKGKPVVILAKTLMGKGVSFMEGSMADGSNWHGKAPSAADGEKALAELPETRFGDF
ncbi:Transketolase domain protein [Chloroherpeton thalassium ATCC 35110]|uniref:Transketolase domain protein n=1 Tax=Chloroherpeton thalassium (strain ATCC 35110 / GB-78) TaxID=517418 RepID=B3QYX2_CHLT3|nr:Transketolase domain protein [Chloroherpeton thalassium ATCC 35110]